MARQAFRRAVMEAEPRLVEAMFLCEVAAASDVLSGEGERHGLYSELIEEEPGPPR